MKRVVLVCILFFLLSVTGCSVFGGYEYEELTKNLEEVVLVERYYTFRQYEVTEIKTISNKEVVLEFAEELCGLPIASHWFGSPPSMQGKAFKLVYFDGSYDLIGDRYIIFYNSEEDHSKSMYDGLSWRDVDILIEKYFSE